MDASIKTVRKKATPYICPLCGGTVSELPQFYGCDNYLPKDGNCKYKIYKTMFDVPIPAEMLEEILAKGETSNKLDGFCDKNTGQPIKAKLRYDKSRNLLVFVEPEPTDYNVDYKIITNRGTFMIEKDKPYVPTSTYNRLFLAYFEKFNEGEKENG